MSFGRTVTLSTGATLPQIGLGTWLSKPKEVENAVEYAVKEAGYRHLDLAYIYENQDEVGAALKKLIPNVVKREDLFITSKVWNTAHKPELVEKELDDGLKQTGIDYFDLYLIHWPVAFKPGKGLQPPSDANPDEIDLDLETPIVDTWKAVINLPKSKVKAIGVSNFNIAQLEGIIKATGVVPAVNQIEAHPYLPQDDLVAYCKSKNIHITAYSPLGNNMLDKPKLTEHPVVKAVADKLGATTAQVLVAWGAKRGYSVIPKSVQPERLTSNFKQVELSDEDYEKIYALGKNEHTRFNIPYLYSKPVWNINIFDEPEEQSAKHKPFLGI
ncbi:Aldo/keto reductase [Cylindrobasidium torrendii FP15055 ss-10]|uniref:Aldo/keto reductase n=1 Tax=Cylindrobasidium torrendii FP15055 ss-10 TaxID=1314674 RepID=A0A0D7BH34_9AGAR|nr:Aldo/keto reductase [Cylindrobasidium torrendii FP15055 ss-10]